MHGTARHPRLAAGRRGSGRSDLGIGRQDDDIVEPEHLALALMSVKSGSCYETLKEFSIDPEYISALIMQAMGLPPEQTPEWF